ncbi:Two-component system sensor histidine kinase [hydrothermal vent metagenome]|uniref:Two-component system sensor histidine kinase n=1 Tax=hydrothermal vent metagenome TaxID=652676 RepID=A0A3B0WL70_9ZZZZ
MNIGAVSYSISAFTFLIFLAILLTDRHQGATKRALLVAASVSCIWSFYLAYETLLNDGSVKLSIIEYFKTIAWLFLLVRLLSIAYSGRFSEVKIKKIQLGLLGIMFILIMPELLRFIFKDIFFFQDIEYLTALNLLMAIVGIVFVEQVYRNTRPEQKWAIKYLCLGLLGMYIYDFYMYSDALLYQRIDPILWQARGFIYALTVPLIGVSISRDPLWSPEIFISRRVVFHTTTLLSSGIYLMVMGIAGYYVRDFGGNWGLVAQAIFLFLTILILILFLSSRRIRAKVIVLVNKHFYPYKYDYREEWLRFIRTLSTSSEEKKLHHNTIKSIAQIIESPGGMLWLREDSGFFVCAETWEMEHVTDREPAETSLPKFLEEHEFVISVDEFIAQPEVYNRLGYIELPEWVKRIQPWLIVPLIYNDLLIGFIVLDHSNARKKTFNWEDSDLLKTAARQVAAFLEQMNASEALAEARQFENFNKVSTYIIHDIKNLVAQLSLISSNAEKHKDNPLFMEDVFKTINNSVSKMNKMMEVLSGKVANSKSSKVNIISVLEELVHNRQIAGGKPVPILGCESGSFYVKADKAQLLAIIGHLVQNAQDATEDHGKITISQMRSTEGVVIEIEDNGSGMSDDFIKNNLFKPFKTTKGTKGMGIGVYEAREIILAIGGQIEVSSKINIGTCFKLTIPATD